jgi:hypothetical protein
MENSHLDELDAIQSFDSIIDSFDETDGKDEEISHAKPVSTAQTNLESLFVRPVAATEIREDSATKPSSDVTSVHPSTAVGPSEHETTRAPSMLDSSDVKATDKDDQPSEDVRGPVKRHSAAARSTDEQ